MSTPCFLLHIGQRWIASAKGVEELEKKLRTIEYEIGWLKELSGRYKNGVSYGAIAIAVQAMRYAKQLNPPRVNSDIFELWCRTFNFEVQTILYREEDRQTTNSDSRMFFRTCSRLEDFLSPAARPTKNFARRPW